MQSFTSAFDDFLYTILHGGQHRPTSTPQPQTPQVIQPDAPYQPAPPAASKISQTTAPNQPQPPSPTRPAPISQATPQASTPTSITDVKNVAQTLAALRGTANFIKNASRLFDSNAYLLTPQLATDILRAAGVPVPKEVQISVATAQVIASGGAVASALNAGASFGQVAVPSAAMIDGMAHLGKMLGWLDISEEQMTYIDMGTDAAMIIGSAGANVMADVKFVLDSYKLWSIRQAGLEQDVRQNVAQRLQNWAQPIMAFQAKAAADNFKKLQQGEIDMFQFTAYVAAQSGEIFPKVFPEIGAFFPPVVTATFTAECSESESFMGIQTGSASYSQSLSLVISRFGGWAKFFDQFTSVMLDPILDSYNRVLGEDLMTEDSDGNRITNRLGLNSLAVMSMLPPCFQYLDPNFDVRGFLALWCLTPGDFPWDDCITAEMQNPTSQWFAAPQEANLEAPITLNGVDYMTPAISQAGDINKMRNALRAAEIIANKNGDIDTLLKDPKCSQLIQLWGQIRDFGPSAFRGLVDEKGNVTPVRVTSNGIPQLPLPQFDKTVLSSVIRVRNSLLNGEWRNIQNYMAVLSLMSAMGINRTNKNTGGRDYIPDGYNDIFQAKYPQLTASYNDINLLHRQCYQKMMFRNLNKFAFQNIAKFLNVPVEKLTQVNKNNLPVDGPGIFKVN